MASLFTRYCLDIASRSIGMFSTCDEYIQYSVSIEAKRIYKGLITKRLESL